MGKKRKRPQKATTPQDVPVKKQRAITAVTVEHPVLSKYYRRVLTLRRYLLEELPSSSKARRRRITSVGKRDEINKPDANVSTLAPSSQQVTDAEFARFLDSTLVGILHYPCPAELNARQREFALFSQSDERSLLCTDTGPCNLQSEVVEYVISHLFRRSNKPQHVLANGFSFATRRQIMDQGIGAMSFNIPGLVSQFHNPHVTALKMSPWTDVLSLLGGNGEDIMSKLLIDCGVFSCVDEEKASYRQISGTYLSELETLELEDAACENQKTGTVNTAAPPLPNKPTYVLHKPNSIIFVRRRMLYARPAINSKGDVRFGLRHIHVLNRFSNSSNLADTVHVMKYIFPRQFGLHNVFTSVVDSRETVQPFKDYTLREEEIARLKVAQGSRYALVRPKIPKRLRGGPLQLVQKLQKRNQTCAYTELLRHYCPISETGPSKFGPVPPSTDEIESQELVTQTSLPSQSLPSQSEVDEQLPDATVSARKSERFPREFCLLGYATPTSSVSAFCRATLRKLIPREFFGEGQDGISNERKLMHQVDRFIRISRFESLSLHEACNGFKITSLRWLEPPSCPSSNGEHIALSDLRKRTEILHEFMYYIFDSLLIPLVRTNFYVTESQVHKNRLYYFRHDVWRLLIEKPLVDMKSSMFEEIKRDKVSRVLKSKKLSWSSVRLLPKASGARPIINLRRRVAKHIGNHSYLGPSTNSTITPVFNMLSYEKDRNPELLGSSMFSVNDMYPRLKAFKDRLMRSGYDSSNGQLYFVKLDIQSCFDTIPQHSLVKLIENLVTQAVYHISKHVEVRPGDSIQNSRDLLQKSGPQQKIVARPLRKYLSKAKGLSEIRKQTSGFKDDKPLRRNTIQVDTATFKNHQVDALLDLLSEHVRKNLVKIGKKYFRQKNGIPQGSVLSSLLCNFFYGQLEREVLGFLKDDETLLLRLIDDFLLITTRPKLAKKFLQIMLDGQPEYGITVNASKSLVNFEATINGTKMPRLEGSSSFPYCGNLIDTHTLDIRKDRDYSRGGEVDVADTLTVESSRIPGQAFHRKVLSSFRLQTHSMFLDTQHNNLRTVLMGIYSNFVETAIKMYRYIKTLLPRQRPSSGLVLQTIRDTIQFAKKLIQSKRRMTLTITKTFDDMDKGINEPQTDLKFQCAVSPAQIEYLGAAAFRHILSRKQTNYASTLQGLQHIMLRNKPRTDKDTIRARWIIREANKMFDNWRY
ncbi:telomerase reverse transcriptase, putative [Talaromyces stipitatus ATCC 10500]|uniref:Telomerase reverse transcriptase n=1 Tax=Talaromyces stipitatus (strain ATCC 10500 / CBS 375.48 / QM 6759 / NRRL 1006) TaxID=441959 RepID=B8MCI8_TALSN|nr:telomerase reverse transcriptase, putative [Talaromyces stipitatus ATCC 10500]EED18804.1 telomerase reverse transcriptase, putative [Talaromyces stipitatus ATCC 10500]